LKERSQGILSRNFWITTIDQYVDNNADTLSTDYTNWIKYKVSESLNLSLFGLTSRQIRIKKQIKASEKIRDYMPAETLTLVNMIEKGAALQVKNKNIEPYRAIENVIDLLGIEPDKSRIER
jgi:hypothetical protein